MAAQPIPLNILPGEALTFAELLRSNQKVIAFSASKTLRGYRHRLNLALRNTASPNVPTSNFIADESNSFTACRLAIAICAFNFLRKRLR